MRMNNDRVPLLKTFYDNLTAQETIEIVSYAIRSKQQIHHTVINANKIVLLQKDLQLQESVNSSDIINIDGAGVLWAAKLLGKPVKERVAGIDLMESLMELAYVEKFKVYFLGAKEEILEKLVGVYTEKYDKNIIAGYRNGYFSKNEEKQIVKEIANANPQILFVAMPSPKKENFLFNYKSELKDVNFIMGVGGSFDVLSGQINRAPKWMQKIGMEWFFRLIQEPKKMWKRYLIGNISFLYIVAKSKFTYNS